MSENSQNNSQENEQELSSWEGEPGSYNQNPQQGYYNQNPQQGYQQFSQNSPNVKPASNLVWAILTTLFCCLPFGIVSIVYSAKVDNLWSTGQYDASRDASKKAKTWAIVAACVAGVWVIVYILLVVFGVLSASLFSDIIDY